MLIAVREQTGDLGSCLVRELLRWLKVGLSIWGVHSCPARRANRFSRHGDVMVAIILELHRWKGDCRSFRLVSVKEAPWGIELPTSSSVAKYLNLLGNPTGSKNIEI